MQNSIIRKFADLERRLRRLETRRSLGQSTIGAGGTLNVDGTLDVSGALDVSGLLAVGGDANFAGDTTIGGNMAVTGTLSLPAGIIDNDALANPVSAGVANADSSGTFPNDGTSHSYATGTIGVPAGFSQALVMAVASAGSTSSGTGGQLSINARIDGVSGAVIATNIPDGSFGSVTGQFARLVTGLSGGSITCIARAAASFNSVAGTSNTHISALALFLR